VLLIIGTFGFSILTGSDIKDSNYRTMKTLAFMFEDESTNSERFLEIFLAIFGVFIIWWVLWSVADMLLDGNLVKYIKREIHNMKMNKMKNHTIIVGGGRVGEEIALVLKTNNKDFVIIDNDTKVVNELKQKDYTVIEGDATNDLTLKNAGIKNASKIVFTLPKTESNIMMTISAKELNPKIEVHSRCDKHSLVSKLKKVGAKIVVVPEIEAADRLAVGLID
jgi:voltage-gated potassium channel